MIEYDDDLGDTTTLSQCPYCQAFLDEPHQPTCPRADPDDWPLDTDAPPEDTD